MFTEIGTIIAVLTVGTTIYENDGLTIEEVIRTACINRAEINQAELQIESSNASLLNSTLWFTPTVYADAGLNAVSSEAAPADIYSSSLSVTASMSLFNLQSIGSRRTASVALSTAKASAAAVEAAVIFDAASSYYSVLQTEKALELAELNLSTQEDMYDLVKARFDAGMISRYEYLAGHVTLENSRPAYTAAEAALLNARGNLAVAMGVDADFYESIAGSLSQKLPVTIPASATELADIALLNSSETTLAELSLELAETQTFTAQAGYAPSINLNGNIGWNASSTGFDELDSENFSRTASAGVSMHVPIFSSFNTETQVRTARNSELTAELELQRTIDLIRQSSLEAWNSYTSAEQRLMGAHALVLEAQEALDIAEVTYQAGSITRLELEQSVVGLVNARENRSAAQLSMRLSELNIALLTGEIHNIWEVK